MRGNGTVATSMADQYTNDGLSKDLHHCAPATVSSGMENKSTKARNISNLDDFHIQVKFNIISCFVKFRRPNQTKPHHPARSW